MATEDTERWASLRGMVAFIELPWSQPRIPSGVGLVLWTETALFTPQDKASQYVCALGPGSSGPAAILIPQPCEINSFFFPLFLRVSFLEYSSFLFACLRTGLCYAEPCWKLEGGPRIRPLLVCQHCAFYRAVEHGLPCLPCPLLPRACSQLVSQVSHLLF